MKNLAIYLAAGASALLVTAASAAPLSPMHRLLRRATFKTSAWFAMRPASAGASVVNAVSLSVNTAIHTDMLPAASVISSVAAMGKVAGSASARPASASESALIATDKADNL